ncbi:MULTISPECIES: competence type IV pilus minor pilin ComGD [Bacillaceae]|uniref:competence type IV pilus minor pilin ComGD n=1 Tax=Bacillaceae TaxID=186817 RepID=UPI001E5BF80A|nr:MULTISPECIES: competence type IV pilus minor pilin ComGD [Bacillaceae]MCE4047064.1 type II secretion system GspH family protein [Bacillus sp. Au-Bac7]MCM3030168.1 type II secretion system GspH family protein [Niallia sp. MER 6]MDL0437443.1 competence type IV pilus minor pilin ComGD [Niallia sp. SS-2023]UPO86555.1 type II secretion system GspH family protein [Niallia sp. Man26]
MKINSQSGFTLLEMLAVLSIVLVLLAVTPILLKPQSELLQERTFFTQLQTDLFYAQNYALAHQKTVYVQINPADKRYYIRGDLKTGRIVDRIYHDSIKINEDAVPIYFTITPSGNVSKFASYRISIGSKKYLFTIQIGRGRFYVKKQ